MRVALRWGASLLVALGLGLGSARWMLRHGIAEALVRNGAWQTSRETGSPDAGMYIRAQVAVAGLLALNPSEAMYYRAASDDAGHPLTGDCDFVVEGRDPATRWWSLTAYAADNFLIPNSAERYSFSRTTVARETDGGFRIVVSARPHAGNWLPVAPGEPFDLTLRLYNPEPALTADLAGTPLPRITRTGCS
ncbi:MAG: DUF1214 domain-containing protein [Deltaproteobacteria bacterium]|nr:DUF1214 domain-containing protein [Deltaproteobacteria bacterium]